MCELIYHNFSTMGNVCCLRSRAPSVAGDSLHFTKEEQKLIRDFWFPIVYERTYKENGTIFFLMYPYMQEYFQDFMNQDLAELRHSVALRAHGVSVLTAITTLVDCMDDIPTMVYHIRKRGDTHYPRGVTYEDMENIKKFILIFLKETSANKKNATKALVAWDKLLTIHNIVYKARLEEIKSVTEVNMVVTKKTQETIRSSL